MAKGLERGVWLAGGIAIGAVVGGSLGASAAEDTDTIYRKLEVLAEVIGHIENFYVDPVSAEGLIYGANRGAVSALDPHSMFFDPAEYQGLLDSTEGEYAGIGVDLEIRDDAAEVVTVLDRSPAAEAGVQRGDSIVGIDDFEVSTMGFDEVQRRLRGAVGTKVVLHLRKPNRDRVWKFTLIRNWIRVPPMRHTSIPGGVEYVHLKTFPRRVASDLDNLLGKAKPRALILDLRNNPGGLFDEAIEVCDLFLKGGPIVTAVGKGGRQVEERTARQRATQGEYPLAILIDRGSASAAEVVAGALQDRKRARLFGSRSYGKGSVQSILDLSDGSGLKLTIARYYTPSGRRIDGTGIEPDVVTDVATTEDDEAMETAMEWLISEM